MGSLPDAEALVFTSRFPLPCMHIVYRLTLTKRPLTPFFSVRTVLMHAPCLDAQAFFINEPITPNSGLVKPCCRLGKCKAPVIFLKKGSDLLVLQWWCCE